MLTVLRRWIQPADIQLVSYPILPHIYNPQSMAGRQTVEAVPLGRHILHTPRGIHASILKHHFITHGHRDEVSGQEDPAT